MMLFHRSQKKEGNCFFTYLTVHTVYTVQYHTTVYTIFASLRNFILTAEKRRDVKVCKGWVEIHLITTCDPTQFCVMNRSMAFDSAASGDPDAA